MTEVNACFAVGGSTARTMQLDITDKTPEEIAALIDAQFDGVSMCHQCAPDCEDPEAELTAFTIGDAYYELRDGRWMVVTQ